MKRFSLLILVLTISSIINIQSQNRDIQTTQLSDSATISLFTNTPSNDAVYALYGHTGIRVADPKNNIDCVFNYGIFSFDSSNFIFRFVRGETDYRLEAILTEYYLMDYQMRGVGITQQDISLTPEEKQKLWNALLTNLKPENKVYRYNFFYDNCATRPRDIIEANINGKISYTPTDKEQTYRDLVYECVKNEAWTRFGINLVIGADADKIITDRQKDFLPLYLQNAYHGATIKTDSIDRPLVSNEYILLAPDLSISMTDVDNTNWPLIVGCILLATSILVSVYSYKKHRYTLAKLFDTLLFLVAGLGGVIIFFLMFFSTHPCVNPNWNIVWLNPLQLVVAFLFFVKPLAKYIYYYHFINFVALSAFLLAWCLIPQYLEVTFIPYILAIGLQSGMNVLLQKKKCVSKK